MLCYGVHLHWKRDQLVLNISTGNVISSILAVLTVVGIMSAALGIGIVGIYGWDLGISESISVVILIGFSLDYSLHIGGARLSDPMSCKWAEPATFFLLQSSCSTWCSRYHPACCRSMLHVATTLWQFAMQCADAYIHSSADNRVDRTREALQSLGVSILAGANTINLAGFWLWFAIMKFLSKSRF